MSKGKCEFQPNLIKKKEYYWLRPGADKYYGKCELCKKEFSGTWGCESAIKKYSGGGKYEENIKLCQSSKNGLSSLFFPNVPTTVSSSPSAPASNTASKSTSASCDANTASKSTSAYCDAVITSVSGAAASTPRSSATTDSFAPNQTMVDQLVASQALVTSAECRMILRILKDLDNFKSCLGLGTDLKTISPDRRIGAYFTLPKTKCVYMLSMVLQSG